MEINAKMNLGAVSSPPPAARPVASANPADQADSFASSNALLQALKDTPDVRPDVVARGRAAVTDNGYPPSDVVSKLSSFLANKLQIGSD